MTNEEAIEQLTALTENSTVSASSAEALEMASDALAFVQGLHEMFQQNAMTAKENSDLNELENLVDAVHGELAAACIFLSEPSFSRVPDMLRLISKKLNKQVDEKEVPFVVIKGYERLAKRIEVTRLNMQALAKKTTEPS